MKSKKRERKKRGMNKIMAGKTAKKKCTASVSQPNLHPARAQLLWNTHSK
jgi:hypothetical protein